MLRRILASAIIAGVAAGLVLSAVQAVWVVPLILHAETFEHKAEAGKDTAAAGTTEIETDAAWEPAAGAQRRAFTVLTNVLIGVGFGLFLVAAVALSGRAVDWRRGLLWGLAGFAVFAIAPALGLPPEPPGVDAGPVPPRQIWWVSTAVATALGLGLLVFARPWWVKVAAVAILALPHIIGVPTFEGAPSLVPEELVRTFVVASLATTGIFWIVLGGLSGFLYRKLA